MRGIYDCGDLCYQCIFVPETPPVTSLTLSYAKCWWRCAFDQQVDEAVIIQNSAAREYEYHIQHHR